MCEKFTKTFVSFPHIMVILAMQKKSESLTPLANIMRQLRDPKTGCPWDLKQSFETIAPYTIEEAYEVEDAIRKADHSDLKTELGDLLFQVIFMSQIAEEKELFQLDDVILGICEKMVRRHPHVFEQPPASGKTPVSQATDAAIKQNWEEIKQAEREAQTPTRPIADRRTSATSRSSNSAASLCTCIPTMRMSSEIRPDRLAESSTPRCTERADAPRATTSQLFSGAEHGASRKLTLSGPSGILSF